MIPKGKAVLLCLATALTVSAMACSSASASLSGLFYERPSKAITGDETVGGVVGSVQIQYNDLGGKSIIVCTKNTILLIIFPSGKTKIILRLEKCRQYQIKEGVKTDVTSTCQIKEPIELFLKDKLITQSKAGVVADNIEPETGSTLFEVTIGGKECLLTGGTEQILKAEGSFIASLGDQAEEALTEHEMVVNEAGSNVTLEGSPAALTYTASGLRQNNGKGWYVD